MSGQLIGPVSIELSPAQYRFLGELIETHKALGDCTERGFTLTFADYEGANVFHRKVFGLKIASTRAYVTMVSIEKKLNAAILLAADKAKGAAR